MKNTTHFSSSLSLLASKYFSPLVRSRVLFLTAAILLLLATGSTAFAGSATWKANPGSGDWNTASNWTPATIPNGFSDTATFASSNTTGVSTANTRVNGIVFNAGASAFTITPSPRATLGLTISGAGVTNNSGIIQNFVTTADAGGARSIIRFTNRATAGSLTVFSNNSPTANNDGLTYFLDSSDANNATLIANGGVGGAPGGSIRFFDKSRGGTARVEVFGNGDLDISGHDAPGVSTGSIEGDGNVFLGPNNLTVGSNNLSTVFSGMIQDEGGFTCCGGGSLTKIGTGKLVLRHRSTYPGGTTIKRGKLIVNNIGHSGTGSGPVQVERGTLGGTGIIAGAVTVGTGSGLGAVLAPGYQHSATPSTFTIESALTFNSDATYKVGLNSSNTTADEVIANGVTIKSGAQFSFVDIGNGALTAGTVFTVINNTAGTPIAGTFSNLADGATFTNNGNSYQVDYQGGTGNDLTLTFVP